MDDLLHLLEPATRAFIQSVRAASARPLAEFSVAEVRKSMLDGQAWAAEDADINQTVHDAGSCRIYMLRRSMDPMDQKILPSILYLHGGGWVLGSLETHLRLVRELVRATGAAVVFPEYALAPENPFPSAVEQCYAALCWTASHAQQLRLDPERIAIAGDSSGGNLAAVVAALAGQRGGPALKLQALLCPVTDCDLQRPSYRLFGHGFYLDAASMEWFWTNYAPDAGQRGSPLASPLHFDPNALKATPPALVLTAECDVLRDEGEDYARKLAASGVPTAAYRCLGTVHSFLLENKLATTPPATSAMRLLIGHIKEAFNL